VVPFALADGSDRTLRIRLTGAVTEFFLTPRGGAVIAMKD